MTRDAAILEYLTAGPWAVKLDILERLAAVVQRHARGELLLPADVEAIALAGRRQRAARAAHRGAGEVPSDASEYRVEGATAIVPVHGLLVRHSRLVNGESQPRGTSYETIAAQLAEAADDPAVRSILLDVDSPGGIAIGLSELAEQLRDGLGGKPLVAYANGMAASAAYYLASQADMLIASRDAMVGSIGTYMVVVDSSAAAEAEGLRVHVLRSAPHKGVGEPGAPIGDDQLAALQAEVDSYADLFRRAVLAGRARAGLTADDVAALADGRVWVGQEAVDVRLADRIGTLAHALAEAAVLADSPQRRRERRADAAAAGPAAVQAHGSRPVGIETEERTHLMSEQKPNPAATIAELEAAFPGDAPAVLAALKAGRTVEQAKAAAYDALKASVDAVRADADARVKALAEENASLKALLAGKAMKAGELNAGEPSDAETAEQARAAEAAAAAAGAKPGEAYVAAVKARIAAGETEGKAHAAVAQNDPKLHEEWVAAGSPWK